MPHSIHLFACDVWRFKTLSLMPAPRRVREILDWRGRLSRRDTVRLCRPILTTLGFSGFIGLCVGKALKAVSGCIAIAVGVVFIGVQVVAHQTGENVDFSSWEKTGWFEKDQVSDAMKAGLAMLTQVCLAPSSSGHTAHVQGGHKVSLSCTAGSAFGGRLPGWTGSGIQMVTWTSSNLTLEHPRECLKHLTDHKTCRRNEVRWH